MGLVERLLAERRNADVHSSDEDDEDEIMEEGRDDIMEEEEEEHSDSEFIFPSQDFISTQCTYSFIVTLCYYMVIFSLQFCIQSIN